MALMRSDEKFLDAQRIADEVIRITGHDVFRNSRKRDYIEARALLNHVLMKTKKFTLHEIKHFYVMNGKPYDHSTAYYSIKQFDIVYKNYNSNMHKWLEELSKKFKTYESKRNILLNNIKALGDKDVDELYRISRDMFNKQKEKETQLS